ncbi:MAG: SsrA-binding protein SmpB [Finegoldia sp.]|nr:SsrA-binding protein SmpB [Finegoldia sp.]
MKDSYRLISNNKKARHEYFIEESYECGIELVGTEVKSIKQGKVSIKEAYCQIENGQVYIYGMHVSPYENGNIFNGDPLRVRKLLLHKKEIRKLYSKLRDKGYTMVPTKVYEKRGLIKLEVGLAKGKHLYDKRQTLKERDDKRRIERALRR